MSDGSTIISPIIKKDGAHVMSFSDEYRAIVEYFGTEDFSSYAANAEVDAGMLVKISEGLTNFIRSSNDPALEWAKEAYAVCTNARVGEIEGTNDLKAVFYLELSSSNNE